MVELKRSQVLLGRAEKFSLLGHLSARLAHEIKNPMASIGAFMQMLPAKYDDEEYRNDFYKVVMEETDRVNNLIAGLLDVVKTEQSRFAPCPLHELIDKMILLVSPQSKARRIDVVRRFDPSIREVWMDAEKMKQVVLNILSNGIEFTPESGRILVTTRLLTEGKTRGGVRIEIADNGIGIPPSCIPRVFDPYFTTKRGESHHHGTGLGLFIAQKSIQDQGGAIEVQSRVDRGTTFVITLPGRPQVPPPLEHGLSSPRPPEKDRFPVTPSSARRRR
jgi:signal transduction histidine kinase